MESAFELEFAFNFIILRNAMGERGINYTISNVKQAFGQVSPDPDDDKCLDTFLYLPVSVCPRRLPDLGGGGGRSKVNTSSYRLLLSEHFSATVYRVSPKKRNLVVFWL